MIIVVSGEKKEVKDNLTLPELIEQENVEMPEYVTVSINKEFVPSDENFFISWEVDVNGNDR